MRFGAGTAAGKGRGGSASEEAAGDGQTKRRRPTTTARSGPEAAPQPPPSYSEARSRPVAHSRRRAAEWAPVALASDPLFSLRPVRTQGLAAGADVARGLGVGKDSGRWTATPGTDPALCAALHTLGSPLILPSINTAMTHTPTGLRCAVPAENLQGTATLSARDDTLCFIFGSGQRSKARKWSKDLHRTH